MKKKLKSFGEALMDYKPSQEHIWAIFHLIMNQRRMTYKFCDLMNYYARCLCCRSHSSLKRQHQSNKTDYYLNKGIRKLDSDLDVVKYLKLVQAYSVMKQVLFNQNERFFMKF